MKSLGRSSVRNTDKPRAELSDTGAEPGTPTCSSSFQPPEALRKHNWKRTSQVPSLTLQMEKPEP